MTVEVIGHRGATGLFPELSLAGFAKALELGVDGIEMDVVLTADRQIVTYHDYALNPNTTRDADGQWLDNSSVKISDLELEELRRYDIGQIEPGSDYDRKFPDQTPVENCRVPTLEEIVNLVNQFERVPTYFIEFKRYAAEPYCSVGLDEFAETIIAEIERLGISSVSRIHSFDWRMLHHFRRVAPQLHFAYLTAEIPTFNTITNEISFSEESLKEQFKDVLEHSADWTDGMVLSDFGNSLPKMIQAAGGTDWHGDFEALTEERIAEARSLGLRVYAWTVNERKEFERLTEAGIDGIITDYPNLLIEFLHKKKTFS